MQASSTLTKIDPDTEATLPLSPADRLEFIRANPALKARFESLKSDDVRKLALNEDVPGFDTLVRRWAGSTASYDAILAQYNNDFLLIHDDI